MCYKIILTQFFCRKKFFFNKKRAAKRTVFNTFFTISTPAEKAVIFPPGYRFFKKNFASLKNCITFAFESNTI